MAKRLTAKQKKALRRKMFLHSLLAVIDDPDLTLTQIRTGLINKLKKSNDEMISDQAAGMGEVRLNAN